MTRLVAMLAGCLLALGGRGQAQVSGPFETLLLLDGQGKADDQLYKGWTQTLGFETGLYKDVSFSGWNAVLGRPELLEMGFAKTLDAASAVIFGKLTLQQVQDSMRIVFVQADRRNRVEVWELALTGVLFTHLDTTLTPGGLPMDHVGFVARTAEWRYIAPASPGPAALVGEAQEALQRAIAIAAAGTELYTTFDMLTAQAETGTRAPDFPGGVDSDGDGMSDAYETTHGLDPAVNDAALDPDGDGMSNLLESICDTNPFALDSRLRITRAHLLGGAVMELRWPARADTVYRIEASPALGTAFTTAKTITATADSEMVTTLPAGANRFFRLRVDE